MIKDMNKQEALKYRVPRFKIKIVRDSRGGTPITLSEESAVQVFALNIGDIPYEEVWVLPVDASSRIISAIKIAQGGIHGCALLAKDVLLPVVASGASGFVMGHNHPSGNCTPSSEDIKLTSSISKLAKSLCIPLLDHIIIAHSDDTINHSSMFNMGLMQ